jgi:hypothetical protein
LVTSGTIFYETTGSAGSRELIVYWNDVPFIGDPDPGSSTDFQLILREGSNEIQFVYGAFSSAAVPTDATAGSATIGIEDPTGTLGLQHSFNTAGAIMDGFTMTLRWNGSNYERVR